jgi:hypothetical protein
MKPIKLLKKGTNMFRKDPNVHPSCTEAKGAIIDAEGKEYIDFGGLVPNVANDEDVPQDSGPTSIFNVFQR